MRKHYCNSFTKFSSLLIGLVTIFIKLLVGEIMVLAVPLAQDQNSNSIDSIFSFYSIKVIYANGKTEESLGECESMSVCNKIDVYDKPWIDKQCKCKKGTECSTSLSSNDGHTIVDRTRQYKLCEPVRRLPKCRYFRDVTWTLVTKGENLTQHTVHCECPKDSVAYMIKRQAYRIDSEDVGFKYLFACSPQTRILCQRKEPCRLFTVKRRSNITDVNTSTLCQCPRDFNCPSHHLEAGVISGKYYPENMIKTYSGYCIQ